MPKRRFQQGFLKKSGLREQKWVGHWYEYVRVPGGEKRCARSRVIGNCDEMTEAQAKSALQVLINREISQSHALALAKRPELGAQFRSGEALSSSTLNKGAIGELLVAADLMNRGFAVYRAISPLAVCDLVVSLAGELFRVEVKVAATKENGKYSRNLRLKDGNFDILAVVSPLDGSIQYAGHQALRIAS